MKFILVSLLAISSVTCGYALVINEIMSNPTGDDSGREWIELYNDSDVPVDGTGLTISIKGGTYIAVTPVSGGTSIPPNGYAIIGSTVSGATKFMQDYPDYSGPLFRSSISLVNTGVTSIDVKLQGALTASLASYTAAKEGATYSLVSGNYITGTPTPGSENKALTTVSDQATTTQTTGTQSTIPQMAPPSADIVLYLPHEKVVVAGAPTVFSVYSLTNSGVAISNMTYAWSFGDGGERTGASTTYRYFYPGRYVTQVEGTNGLVAGTARMLVRVVSPEISMSSVLHGKYGAYIDITNPNTYDLDVSGWKLTIDGVPFSFPKNMLLPVGTTHVSGMSMGFASTTVSSSTIIKILFPNLDEVVRVIQGEEKGEEKSDAKNILSSPYSSLSVTHPVQTIKKFSQGNSGSFLKKATSSITGPTTTHVLITQKKDTRIASFIRSIFGR